MTLNVLLRTNFAIIKHLFSRRDEADCAADFRMSSRYSQKTPKN